LGTPTIIKTKLLDGKNRVNAISKWQIANSPE